MARKLIELRDELDDELARAAETRGQSESEIIERAVEMYLEEGLADDDVITDPAERAAILDAGAGMWKDRTDLPDFAALRGEWDARVERLLGDE